MLHCLLWSGSENRVPKISCLIIAFPLVEEASTRGSMGPQVQRHPNIRPLGNLFHYIPIIHQSPSGLHYRSPIPPITCPLHPHSSSLFLVYTSHCPCIREIQDYNHDMPTCTNHIPLNVLFIHDTSVIAKNGWLAYPCYIGALHEGDVTWWWLGDGVWIIIL